MATSEAADGWPMPVDEPTRLRRRSRRFRQPRASFLARLRRVLVSGLALASLAACVLGLGVRLTVQDKRSTLFCIIYYATPPAVLAGLALASGGLWLLRRRWKLALPPVLIGAACAVWSYEVTWFHNPPAPTKDAQRVLFWNVARGACGWKNVAADIRRRNPDIVGLVEAGRDVPRLTAFWQRELPGYYVHVEPCGITFLARSDARLVGGGSLDSHGAYHHFTLPVDGQLLHVVIADFDGSLTSSRWWAIAALVRVIEPLDGQPVLVMGDFNTPTDSCYLKALRRRLMNAFEVAGDGCAATWPFPLPVLTLDQAWFSEHVHVARCTHGWSWYSDHRPVELEVSVTQ